jgi:dephospho-CoA kinase
MASLKIGIAGYMGAGKTSVSHMLSDHGIRLIDADQEAKNMMNSDFAIQRKLAVAFGESVFEKGRISSSALGAIAFSTIRQLELLNSIVHPVLLEKLHALIFSGPDAVVALDAALIPLWHIDDWFDVRIWVDASVETRMDRLKKKNIVNNIDRIRERMAMQEMLFSPPSENRWIYVKNDNGLEELKSNISTLVAEIL